VVLQSFSADSLRRLHALAPDLPLVHLLPAGVELTEPLLDDIAAYATGIGPSKGDVDAAFVGSAHAACLAVHPYTVDDPAEMAELLRAGVDGMFTNRPDALRDVIDAPDQPVAPADRCVPKVPS
jgi:glycerophosphoryl diester phosphodiesterase